MAARIADEEGTLRARLPEEYADGGGRNPQVCTMHCEKMRTDRRIDVQGTAMEDRRA